MNNKILITAASLLSLYINPANAIVVYKYVGNNFVEISDRTPPADSYTTDQSIHLEFTVPSPLIGVGPELTNINPLSFTINDGRRTLTEQSFLISIRFELTTDSDGNIIDWFIVAEEPVNNLQVGEQSGQIITDSISNTSGSLSGRDSAALLECTSGNSTQCFAANADSALLISNPGTWTFVEYPDVEENVDLGDGTSVSEGSSIESGTSIGDNSTVGENSGIGNDVQLGENTTVGEGSEIGSDTIAGNNLILGENVIIEKSVIIGARVTIGDNSKIRSGTVIGNDVQIGIIGGGDGVFIGKNVTISSNQTIADGESIANNTTIP